MLFSYFNDRIAKSYPSFGIEQARNISVLYIINILLLISITPWIFLYQKHGAPHLSLTNVGFATVFLFLFLSSAYLGLSFKLYRFLLIITSLIVVASPGIILGKYCVSVYGLLFLPLGMILVFSTEERKLYLRYLFFLAFIFSFLIFWIYTKDPILVVSEEAMQSLNLGDTINVMIASIVMAIIFFQKNSQIQNDLRLERSKSDDLLKKIFPEAIAKRLKSSEESVVDDFKNVTVIFIDIVGFTRVSGSLKPIELVSILDEVFSSFDAIASNYNIEKIKTIGDGYMAVAGLPEPDNDHHLNAANFGLEIINLFSTKYKQKHSIDVRIGMHTGSVIAGVIGNEKFAYDLWGTTVNKASRFETSGQAGKIHISSEFKDLIVNDYKIKSNGRIVLKGLGEEDSYFLEGVNQ